MTSQKLRSHVLAFTALPLLLALGSAAQNQSSLATPSTLTPTVLHFADGGDTPGRITTDAAGNLYIAASFGPFSNKSTFGVLKYSFDGKTRQVIRDVPQPGEFAGMAHDVTLDAQRNLYVVGTSSIGGLIVSFTPAGKQRWSDRFDSAHASMDARSVVLDAQANVYVGGVSSQPGNELAEWTVAKYSSTGKELWLQHHVGKMEGSNQLTDIALDAAGNVFALGLTQNVGAFLKNDLTVVKYDANGNEVFVRDFTGTPQSDQRPGALAVDRAGNVYATFTSLPTGQEGEHIPVTLKYDPTGNLLFTLIGDGMGGSSVSLDPAGNVLLSGLASHPGPNPPINSAAKFTSSGKQLWIRPVLGAGKILSDGAGNVYVASSVAGSGLGDYFVTRFSPQGTRQLQFRFTPGDFVTDAVVDPFGNLVVTGEGEDAQFNEDIYTIRLPRISATVPPVAAQ